jgi:novobiocin biosynthesis protein NovU/D-mycarose 3-C-methyltransferase
MQVNHCRICRSQELAEILDLGTTALANRFLRPEQLAELEPRFPLRLVLCRGCGLVQIDEEVPRDVLFKDYVYVTGTSELVQQHAERLAASLCKQYGVGTGDLVLEPASNDGTVLKAFQRHGVRVLGVEPAVNIAKAAQAEGIDTLVEFFDSDVGREVSKDHGPARLVIARHVLAHVTDLHGFVEGIREVLAPDGVAVIEAPYLGEMHRKFEFDQVYHEHLCYFSLAVLETLFAKLGLRCIEVEMAPVHGGSFLLHVAHEHGPHLATLRWRAQRGREEDLALKEVETWQRFAANVVELKDRLLQFFGDARHCGQIVAGYGAPAKSTTLLSYCGITTRDLSYIVDKSPHKQGLFTPGQHIPVYHPARIEEDAPDVLLILAWNFAEEVMRQQSAFWRRGGRFAVPIPAPELISTAIAA